MECLRKKVDGEQVSADLFDILPRIEGFAVEFSALCREVEAHYRCAHRHVNKDNPIVPLDKLLMEPDDVAETLRAMANKLWKFKYELVDVRVGTLGLIERLKASDEASKKIARMGDV